VGSFIAVGGLACSPSEPSLSDSDVGKGAAQSENDAAAAQSTANATDAAIDTADGSTSLDASASVVDGGTELAEWPSAKNTGHSGALTDYSGPTTITTNGTLVENARITKTIYVNANNVTFRNCHFQLANDSAIVINVDPPRSTTGLLIEQSTLENTMGGVTDTAAVSNGGYTIRRSNVFGWVTALKTYASKATTPTVIEDNYIHGGKNGSGGHQEAIHMEWGSSVTIRHNWIEQPTDGTATVSSGLTGHTDILVERNVIGGLGGYAIQVGDGCTGVGAPSATCDGADGKIVYKDNRILTGVPGVAHPTGGFFGTWYYGGKASISGTVWHNSDSYGHVEGAPCNPSDFP